MGDLAKMTSAILNAAWRKSRFCNGASACVEVALLPDGNVGVRDSKDSDGPCLEFSPAEWSAFTVGVRAGEFDLLALGARLTVDGADGDARTRAQNVPQSHFGAASVSQ